MKRFKKVLALVLAGVLALAMLTACDGGTTDPDSIMPEDGTPEVVMTVNNMAANKGLGQVKYNNKINNTTYWENYRKITAELGSVKIVVGMTSDYRPGTSDYNPASKTSFKYDSLFKDESAFNLAEKIGVAYVPTSNGTVYQAVCLFDVN